MIEINPDYVDYDEFVETNQMLRRSIDANQKAILEIAKGMKTIIKELNEVKQNGK